MFLFVVVILTGKKINNTNWQKMTKYWQTYTFFKIVTTKTDWIYSPFCQLTDNSIITEN